MGMSSNDIECELGYAYLHAVAAAAGMSCSVTTRLDDNAGVDARVVFRGSIPGTYRTEVDLNVQLKATAQAMPETDTHLSYFLAGTKRYNDLVSLTVSTPRVLMVLRLAPDSAEWLTLDADQLVLKRCAYWVSLRGLPVSTNKSGETVYLPKANVLSPAALKEMMYDLAKGTLAAPAGAAQ